MALPAEFNTVQVYGTYLNLDGTPVIGYLTFEASPAILKAAVSKDLIVPVVLQVNLDGTGHFSINLPSTDDPDVNPSDWTYKVTEGFGTRRVYYISVHLAAGPSINIYDLAPVEISAGTYYLQGDPGPAGPPARPTTGQPSNNVGVDGDYALDAAAGVIYKNINGAWDTGTHLAAADIAAHAALSTGVHGVGTGAVVGTDEVQALSNKTLVAPVVTSGITADSAHVTGAVQVDGALGVTGAATLPAITGPVTVSGSETVTGQLTVQGSTSLQGVTVGGNLDAGANTITAHEITASDTVSAARVTISGTPTSATDAATKGYVDNTAGTDANTSSALVRRDATGSAQFQTLGIAAAPTAGNQATRKDYVDNVGVSAPTASTIMRRDANGRSQVADPAAAGDISTKNYVDTNFVLKSVSVFSKLETQSTLLLDQQAADPAAPTTAGQAALWKANDKGIYVLSQDAAKRRLAQFWGSSNAFPLTPLVGDSIFRTDIGTNGSLWHYAGGTAGSGGWVHKGVLVCTSTTRPATNAYAGLMTYETDTNLTMAYDGVNWVGVGSGAWTDVQVSATNYTMTVAATAAGSAMPNITGGGGNCQTAAITPPKGRILEVELVIPKLFLAANTGGFIRLVDATPATVLAGAEYGTGTAAVIWPSPSLVGRVVGDGVTAHTVQAQTWISAGTFQPGGSATGAAAMKLRYRIV